MYRLNVYRTWHIEATPQHPFIHFHTFMNWQLVACLHIYKDTKRNERTTHIDNTNTTNQTKREEKKLKYLTTIITALWMYLLIILICIRVYEQNRHIQNEFTETESAFINFLWYFLAVIVDFFLTIEIQ